MWWFFLSLGCHCADSTLSLIGWAGVVFSFVRIFRHDFSFPLTVFVQQFLLFENLFFLCYVQLV